MDDLPPDFNDNPFIDACDQGPVTLPTDPGSCSAMFTFQKPTASDSCCTASVPVSVSAIDENGFIIPLTEFTSNNIVYETGSFPQTCVGSNVVTSTANDGRGNTAQAQCALYVFDNQPPSIVCSNNQTVACTNGPVVYVDPMTSDNCPNFTVSCTPTNGSFLGVGVYNVTCTAIDGCGQNTNSCTFTLNVVDTTPPTITCPSNTTVQCGQPTDPSNTGSATAIDDCDPNPSVTSTDSVTGTCPTYIYRTWIAVDFSGNTNQCTQVITVVDTTPPSILCPADVQLQCGASTDPSNTGSATATDTCSTATITFVDTFGATNCTGKAAIARIWTATDTCANSASCTQNITFVDTTAPVITCPADQQLQCGASTDPSNTGSATATDNCGGSVAIKYSDTPTAANCTGMQGISRVWTATDGCGNSASCTQNISFVDTTAPVITCPANVQLQCGASTAPANTGSATATDNCSSQVHVGSVGVTVTYSDTPTPANCTGNPGISRVWTATDGCGNSASCTQSISFVDTTAPVITCPANVQLQCGASTAPANTGSATATDNCGGTVTITHTDSPTPANCTGNPGIARIWTATDACGNSASCTQSISFVDTTAPVITCPANVQLQCGASTAPANTGSATATDNCGGTVTITHTDSPTPANCTGNPGIARIWTATDACGNSASCTQSISFVDTTAPVITCPANVQLQCGASTAPANTGSATATDNCGGTVTITYTDTPTAANCTGKAGISRTWKATDACGNSSTCVQSISFVDTTAPVITCPANVQLQCGGSTAPANTGSATATDNCGGTVTITYTDTPTAANCTGKAGISRTWKATDACGNSSTCVQTISFVDTTAPVITCPAAKTVSNLTLATTNYTGVATATDNCTASPVITYSDSVATNCGYVITRTWKATDGCGNVSTCTQTITVPGAGSICGTVFSDCTGFGDLDGDDPGLSNALVTLYKTNGTVAATTTSGANGAYCFYNLAAGTYIISNAPSGHFQTGGTCTNHWSDSQGRDCWYDVDGYSHYRNCGTNTWVAKDGYTHCQSRITGLDTWVDSSKVTHTQTCYTSCDKIIKTNTITIVLGTCQNKTGVNFAQAGFSSICGTVFLDCDGHGDLDGDEPGLSNSVVTLKSTNGTTIATSTTDKNGNYCFYNLVMGVYVVSNAPNSFVESGGTCTNHWPDSKGRDCWYDVDGYTHYRNCGTNTWVANDGYTHCQNKSTGLDTWTDSSGKTHTQTCYTSCDKITKTNTITVVLGACQNKTGVNFVQAPVAPKIVCTVKGPSGCSHGQTITYSCTVTNTGNACFSKGCNVYICGGYVTCPNLGPGQFCSFNQNYTVPSGAKSPLTCTATAYGYTPFGTATGSGTGYAAAASTTSSTTSTSSNVVTSTATTTSTITN